MGLKGLTAAAFAAVLLGTAAIQPAAAKLIDETSVAVGATAGESLVQLASKGADDKGWDDRGGERHKGKKEKKEKKERKGKKGGKGRGGHDDGPGHT